ncbi:MAG: 2-oxoglutarate dehydrogenase complex dihydrolipoyllysine-residue succinyltransferase [Spirochaetes bacterium]|nr:MAG: 2-oxoglutarate dehydrogenase complex dihydrolipoyllysine-residue succinyltransferase [Spirochaetota bacterium]
MKEEVRIPSVGESIVEGMLMTWYKAQGEHVELDEDLYEFETEKASVTVPSPFAGVLEILVEEGSKVKIGQVVAMIDTAAASGKSATVRDEASSAPGPRASAPEKMKEKPSKAPAPEEPAKESPGPLSPAVRRVAAENEVDLSAVRGTGKDGRLTKGDVLEAAGEKPVMRDREDAPRATDAVSRGTPGGTRREALSPIRKSIATHLVAARREAAHLTTFNEINMELVIELRKKHQEDFEKKYGIKLGFMSFFVKAAVEALREFPVVNARIEGEEIVYHDFYDIGVAVSTDRGLIVPIIRNADAMGFADIEKKIADLAARAKNKKILLAELQGGTFSITNGGIFGSLMSTPIPNHPQSAILGMHAVQERPIAVRGEVKIKPMMYVALTYDHRLIDGRDAVRFLVRIKEYIEDPERILLYI